jgi:hypothetical protein
MRWSRPAFWTNKGAARPEAARATNDLSNRPQDAVADVYRRSTGLPAEEQREEN